MQTCLKNPLAQTNRFNSIHFFFFFISYVFRFAVWKNLMKPLLKHNFFLINKLNFKQFYFYKSILEVKRMEITEIIKEAFIFPSQNLEKLAIYIVLTFVLALLAVFGVITALLGINDGSFYFVLTFIFLILGIIVALIITGYQVDVVKKSHKTRPLDCVEIGKRQDYCHYYRSKYEYYE